MLFIFLSINCKIYDHPLYFYLMKLFDPTFFSRTDKIGSQTAPDANQSFTSWHAAMHPTRWQTHQVLPSFCAPLFCATATCADGRMLYWLAVLRGNWGRLFDLASHAVWINRWALVFVWLYSRSGKIGASSHLEEQPVVSSEAMLKHTACRCWVKQGGWI